MNQKTVSGLKTKDLVDQRLLGALSKLLGTAPKFRQHRAGVRSKGPAFLVADIEGLVTTDGTDVAAKAKRLGFSVSLKDIEFDEDLDAVSSIELEWPGYSVTLRQDISGHMDLQNPNWSVRLDPNPGKTISTSTINQRKVNPMKALEIASRSAAKRINKEQAAAPAGLLKQIVPEAKKYGLNQGINEGNPWWYSDVLQLPLNILTPKGKGTEDCVIGAVFRKPDQWQIVIESETSGNALYSTDFGDADKVRKELIKFNDKYSGFITDDNWEQSVSSMTVFLAKINKLFKV